jgi:hypothetical protein
VKVSKWALSTNGGSNKSPGLMGGCCCWLCYVSTIKSMGATRYLERVCITGCTRKGAQCLWPCPRLVDAARSFRRHPQYGRPLRPAGAIQRWCYVLTGFACPPTLPLFSACRSWRDPGLLGRVVGMDDKSKPWVWSSCTSYATMTLMSLNTTLSRSHRTRSGRSGGGCGGGPGSP